MSSGPREKSARERRKHPWPAPAHQRLRLRGETHWRPGTMPSAFRSRGRESRPTDQASERSSPSFSFLLFLPFFFPSSFFSLFSFLSTTQRFRSDARHRILHARLDEFRFNVPRPRSFAPWNLSGKPETRPGGGRGGGDTCDVRYGRARIFSPCSRAWARACSWRYRRRTRKTFPFPFFFLPPRRGGISKMKTNERRMGGFLSNPNRPWKNRAFETDRYEKSTRVSYPYSNKCIISSSLATIRLEQTRAASKRKL